MPKNFAQEYEIHFEEHQVLIKSKKQHISFLYNDIHSCFISNQTDYSRIRFVMNDKHKFILHIGLCYMLNRKKQTIFENRHTLDHYLNDFRIEANGKRRENTILYTRTK